MAKKCLLVEKTKNYIRCRQKNPSYFDKKSFRTKTLSNKTKIITGCKKRHFKKGKCNIGVEIQSILKRESI